MLGGHVDLFFGNVSAALALWRDGKIKALAVLDKTRAAQMPNVPTAAEAGMPDLISTTLVCRGGAAEDAGGVAAADRRRLDRGAEDAGRAGEVPQRRRRAGRRHAGRDRGVHQGRGAPLGRGDPQDRQYVVD